MFVIHHLSPIVPAAKRWLPRVPSLERKMTQLPESSGAGLFVPVYTLSVIPGCSVAGACTVWRTVLLMRSRAGRRGDGGAGPRDPPAVGLGAAAGRGYAHQQRRGAPVPGALSSPHAHSRLPLAHFVPRFEVQPVRVRLREWAWGPLPGAPAVLADHPLGALPQEGMHIHHPAVTIPGAPSDYAAMRRFD